MQFIHSADSSVGKEALSEFLISQLEDHSVLWLLSGGSNIDISNDIMQSIDAEASERLTIGLIDERYGEVGHPDSNFQQLLEAGFTPKAAQFIPVLQAGLSMEKTAERYNQTLEAAFAGHDVVVGQLGIGPDGHTAGILPHSPAIDASNDVLVTSYSSDPYQRVTMTFAALQKLTAVFVFAFGDDKFLPLANLQQQLSIADEPAQILKTISDVYIYNDQIGETT